uniref:Uncharacterized protein MANES_13G153700 n=1 Tax=Rhizophora mucronata TaxID=61149 RepID=A0A2P2MM22_RHIMU
MHKTFDRNYKCNTSSLFFWGRGARWGIKSFPSCYWVGLKGFHGQKSFVIAVLAFGVLVCCG